MAVTVDELLKGKQPPQAPAQQPSEGESQQPQQLPDIMPTGEQAAQMIKDEHAARVQQPAQPPQAPAQQVPAPTTNQPDADFQKGWLDYQAIIDKTYPQKSDEELKKEKKRERLSRLFNALGDGISALSNLYFTTKGAPNAYTGDNTLSERWKARREELRKEAKADEKSRLALLLDALKAKSREESARVLNQIKEAGLDLRERTLAENERKNKANEALRAEANDIKRENLRIVEEYNKGKLSNEEARIAIQGMNARVNQLKAQGYNEEITIEDPTKGTIQKTVSRTPKGGQVSGSGQGNTPPSRQQSGNTPPSRRK